MQRHGLPLTAFLFLVLALPLLGSCDGGSSMLAPSRGSAAVSAAKGAAAAAVGVGALSTAHPHEPANAKAYWTGGWSVPVYKTTNSQGWTDVTAVYYPPGTWVGQQSQGGNTKISTDSVLGIPVGPTKASVWQINYPSIIGKGNATATATTSKIIPSNTGGLYVSLEVYIPSAFTWNGNPGGKVFGFRNNANSGQNHILGLRYESMSPGIFIQNTGGVSLNFFPSYTLTRNMWHQIEFVLQPNTPGIANGIGDIYVDGTSIAHYTNIPYFAAGQIKSYSSVYMPFVFGGNVAAPPVRSPPEYIAIDPVTYTSLW